MTLRLSRSARSSQRALWIHTWSSACRSIGENSRAVVTSFMAAKPCCSRMTSSSMPQESRRDTDMPSFEHHGARIYYEEFGQGFPILTFAPAGLQSVIAVWSQSSAPINPTTEWAANYRVIAMDQRNAGGQSRAPITSRDGWDAYTGDHVALLDHLRIDRCHLYGQCIGGSFILNLIKTQPERVQSAVLAQPIGRVGGFMAP